VIPDSSTLKKLPFLNISSRYVIGWFVYTLLAVAINIVYKFPIDLVLLETSFFFTSATLMYAGATSLSRTRFAHWVAPLFDNLSVMLAICMLIGAISGFVWTFILSNYLINDILESERHVKRLTKAAIHLRYYWGRAYDAMSLFCAFGILWFNSRKSKENIIAPASLGEQKASFLLIAIFIVVNVSGASIVYLRPFYWAPFLINLVVQCAVTFGVATWVIKVFVG